MNRRETLHWMMTLAGSGTILALSGCGKQRTDAQSSPQSAPTVEPVVSPDASPSPTEETADETASPGPEGTPVAEVAIEPKAPYGELTDNQQQRLNTVMEALAEVNANEAKRWTENLAFDAVSAEQELKTWEAIVVAYTAWNDDRPGINQQSKQEAFNLLLMGSLLPVDQAVRYVKLSALTVDDARTILALYVSPQPNPVSSPDPTS